MKKYILCYFLLFLTLNSYSQSDYTSQLLAHRKAVDLEFGDTSQSILPDSMALSFKNLNYFEPNENYCVLAKV